MQPHSQRTPVKPPTTPKPRACSEGASQSWCLHSVSDALVSAGSFEPSKPTRQPGRVQLRVGTLLWHTFRCTLPLREKRKDCAHDQCSQHGLHLPPPKSPLVFEVLPHAKEKNKIKKWGAGTSWLAGWGGGARGRRQLFLDPDPGGFFSPDPVDPLIIFLCIVDDRGSGRR